jgi:methylglutaconyl-CoA hydratase
VSAPVRIERSRAGDTVARVTLARPATRNALDAEAIEALASAFGAFAGESADRLRAVVLAGDGPAFCAGADVGWMRSAIAMSREENEADARGLAAMLAAIDACPVPVIARVQGAALGGGAGLCAVADVVVAEAGARLGFPEVRLGLIPATIAPFVVRRIGEGNARALFTTGRVIDAREASRVGLVHRVAEGDAALDAAVDEVLAAILAGGPEAVRAAKALVRDVAARPAGAAADDLAAMTARVLAERRASEEAREGLAAFVDHRPAAWVPPRDTDP